MKIRPPRINVEKIADNLYVNDCDKKRIISTDCFRDKILSIEEDLQTFFDSESLTVDNELYPQESKPFEIMLKDGECHTVGKSMMHDFYKQFRGSSWKKFKKYFYQSADSRCVYCGVLHANTIDHIFPKEIYYNLSIIPINLVRCCSSCNSIKNVFISKQSVYYPYCEKPLFEFLKVTGINVDTNGIHAEVKEVTSDYSDYMEKLDLKERLSDIIAEEITPLLGSLAEYYDINNEYELVINELKHHRAFTLWRQYLIDALDKLDSHLLKEDIIGFVSDLLDS